MKIKHLLDRHFGGWIPQRPDIRDKWLVPTTIPSKVPSSVDLRPKCPAVYDQGELGSCTANATCFAFEFETIRQMLPDFMPSRLFQYYNSRRLEGDVDQDAGATVRDAMKAIASVGICPEAEWPYQVDQFAVLPSNKCYSDAKNNKPLQYLSVQQDLAHFKGCLADGFPFVFGISVYESFESPQVESTGIVPMPSESEENLGGHCIAAVGYDDGFKGPGWDNAGAFIIRNSWGEGWGQKGYCLMPYDYLMDMGLASDFWSIRAVEATA